MSCRTEGDREPHGRGPFVETVEKMSHYSQHCLSKDFDKMKLIIITIDCLLQSAPITGVHC